MIPLEACSLIISGPLTSSTTATKPTSLPSTRTRMLKLVGLVMKVENLLSLTRTFRLCRHRSPSGLCRRDLPTLLKLSSTRTITRAGSQEAQRSWSQQAVSTTIAMGSEDLHLPVWRIRFHSLHRRHLGLRCMEASWSTTGDSKSGFGHRTGTRVGHSSHVLFLARYVHGSVLFEKSMC